MSNNFSIKAALPTLFFFFSRSCKIFLRNKKDICRPPLSLLFYFYRCAARMCRYRSETETVFFCILPQIVPKSNCFSFLVPFPAFRLRFLHAAGAEKSRFSLGFALTFVLTLPTLCVRIFTEKSLFGMFVPHFSEKFGTKPTLFPSNLRNRIDRSRIGSERIIL